jgi:endonuclease YncB( thermonuclease family)
MHPNPASPARARRRIPKWLLVTLGVVVVLFVLAVIFGRTSEKPVAAPPAPQPLTTTTSVVAPVGYTVDKVVDGGTLELAGSDGSHRTVHVRGVSVATGNDCYATETLAWAVTTLTGTTIRITADTATGVALALPDGTDYATAALQGGYAKYATDAISTSLQAAETLARQANAGLWGAPCDGVIDAGTPQPPQPPAPPQPAPSTKKTKTQAPPPAPDTTTEDAPEPDSSSVYYANCAAARAAGVAPLHIGEPGYRKALDRDGDGVACE